MSVKLRQFKGIAPLIDARNLSDDMAQTAQNCRLSSGAVEPLKDTTVQGTQASAATIYYYRNRVADKWLTFATTTDVARSPIVDDDKDRLYYMKSGSLYVYTNGAVEKLASVTSTPYPPVATLGCIHSFGNKAVLESTFTLTTPTNFWSGTATKTISSGDMHATGWNRRANGYVDFYFIFPNAQILPSTEVVADADAVGDYSITGTYRFAMRTNPESGDDGNTYKPATTGDPVGQTFTLKTSGGDTYAKPEVVGITAIPEVDWNRTSNGSYTTINPTVRQLKITVTVNMNFSAGYNHPGESVYYVWTYGREWSTGNVEEGPPSSRSNMLELYPGDYAVITPTSGEPSPTDAGTYVKYKRLYRAAAGTEEDNWFYVAQMAYNMTTYNDTTASADLNEPLEIVEVAPSNMDAVYTHPAGFLVGIRRRTSTYGGGVFFSEVFKPYSWPTKYQLALDYDPVGCGIAGNEIVILTEGRPYLCTGDDPSTMTLRELQFNQSCVAKKSIVKMANGVGYASPDGYCVIRGGVGEVITQNVFTREQWQAYTPSGFAGGWHDNVLHLFYPTGAILMDMAEGRFAVTTSNIGSSHSGSAVVFVDPVSDLLYMARDGYVHSWATAATYLEATWKSKRFTYPRDEGFVVARLRSTAFTDKTYTLTSVLNGTTVDTQTITSAVDVRLPHNLSTGAEWEFQLVIGGTAACKVYELLLVSKVIQTVGDGALIAKRDSNRETWKGFVVMSPTRKSFSSARVRATSYTTQPRLRVYAGEPLALVHEADVVDSAAFRLPKMDPERMWAIDIEYADDVHEMAIGTSMGSLKA